LTANKTTTVADLCLHHGITFADLAARSGVEETRVVAIMLGRWTPSPDERRQIGAVFGVQVEEVAWGHATPVEHLWG